MSSDIRTIKEIAEYSDRLLQALTECTADQLSSYQSQYYILQWVLKNVELPTQEQVEGAKQ